MRRVQAGSLPISSRCQARSVDAMVQHAAPAGEGEPVLALAGFSFGAFVTTHAFERLNGQREQDGRLGAV